MYVYEVDGVIAGVVDVVDEGEGIYIAALAVAEEYRGRGIGKELVDYVVALAAELGKRYVYAHPLESSEGFFRKLGFTVFDRWQDNLFERVARYSLSSNDT